MEVKIKMYDRQFWNVFKERFGLNFTSSQDEKLIIHFDGVEEDHISLEDIKTLQIEIMDTIDFLILKTKHVAEKKIIKRTFLLHFEAIEEVQFLEVEELDE